MRPPGDGGTHFGPPRPDPALDPAGPPRPLGPVHAWALAVAIGAGLLCLVLAVAAGSVAAALALRGLWPELVRTAPAWVPLLGLWAALTLAVHHRLTRVD